jgi:hypothetical protein
MEKSVSVVDRMAGLVISAALLVAGSGFIVLGVSLLPVAGIFIGLAVIRLAWFFVDPQAIGSERIVGVGGSEGRGVVTEMARAAA